MKPLWAFSASFAARGESGREDKVASIAAAHYIVQAGLPGA
jgi:hypothetical protein